MATITATETERPARHLPGDIHMWVFVLGDLVYFAGYFVIFMVYRIVEDEVFVASREHLNLHAAAVNTLVLLVSSWLVASAVAASRDGAHAVAARRLVQAGGCGVLFAAIKIFEWVNEWLHGYTLTTNEFWMFYFILTAAHFAHVLLGLATLGYLWRELRTPDPKHWVVEAGAVYWHMVDVIWIFMFAFVYLLR